MLYASVTFKHKLWVSVCIKTGANLLQLSSNATMRALKVNMTTKRIKHEFRHNWLQNFLEFKWILASSVVIDGGDFILFVWCVVD